MYCIITPVQDNWIGKQYLDKTDKTIIRIRQTETTKSIGRLRDHIEKEFNYGEQLNWYKIIDRENAVLEYYGFPYDTHVEQSKDLKKVLKGSKFRAYKAWVVMEE